MDALFKWLSGNPIATMLLLIAFGLAVVVCVVICVVAFLQGREITFWPPKVSRRPEVFRWMVQIGEQNIPDPKKKEFYDGTYVGIRTTLVPISFRVPFKRDPKVVVCLKKIDLGSDINRLLVRAENIRLDGFDLCFETWNDSRVYDAAASWIAVAEWRGT